MAKINVKETEITIFKREQEDYISLTDIAKTRDKENPSQIVSLWLRTYNTIEYIGLWEMLNNPDFNPHIYEGFKKNEVTQQERLIKLNQIAIQQMTILQEVEQRKLLK